MPVPLVGSILAVMLIAIAIDVAVWVRFPVLHRPGPIILHTIIFGVAGFLAARALRRRQ